MSQENVEIVKRAVAAVNERDIDAYLACVTEDIEDFDAHCRFRRRVRGT